MRRLLALLLLLPSVALAEKPMRYAVIVGVREYDHSKLPVLQYSENDATELTKLLRGGGYAVELLCDTDGKLNKDYTPTKANIEAKLDAVLSKCKRDDLVLVAFAGHGLQFEKDPDCYFCPRDAKPFDDETKTLVSLDGLYRRLDKCGAGAKVLLADCCRNDPNASRGLKRNVPNDLMDRIPPRGVFACFSCVRGQSAYEHKDLGIGHGVFFYHLLEGLRGKAGPEGEGIDFLDLVSYVNRQVPKTIREKIGGGAEQTPNLKFPDGSGQLVLLERATREQKPGEERDFEIFKGVMMRFCWIPAGEVQLGSTDMERQAVLKQLIDNKVVKDGKEPDYLASEAQGLRGKFKTNGFWLGKYEVTQGEYEGVTGNNPSKFKGEKLPVEQVSWEDCQKFMAKCKVNGMKVKLPHEDEWEYACRGGKGSKQVYFWGNVLNGDLANCNGNFPFGTNDKGIFKNRTIEVDGRSEQNYAIHPWGLCHMSGNVDEWCENLFEGTGKEKVIRGGSWFDFAWFCRSAYRFKVKQLLRSDTLGFRLAMVP